MSNDLDLLLAQNQRSDQSSRTLESVHLGLDKVYRFLAVYGPPCPEQEEALAQILDIQAQVRSLNDTRQEAEAQLRAAVAMLNTANLQLQAVLRDYYQLEEAVENVDEVHPLVAELARRIRDDNDVMTVDGIWELVAEALAEMMRTNGVNITTEQVRAFLKDAQYDDLEPEVVQYLGQLISYVAQARA